MEPPNLDLWRLVGAILGAVQGFIFVWPKSWTDAIRRSLVALVTGFTVGPAVSIYLHWPDDGRFAMASAMVAGLFSWTAIGTGMRLLQGVTKLPTTPPKE